MKIPMTEKGIKRLNDEIDTLIKVSRREVSLAISEAREHGEININENAEYHAAKELQAQIESKIIRLTDLKSKVEPMNIRLLAPDVVNVCAIVTMVNDETGDESVYRVVCEYEASLENGYISNTSPLGRAMIGKESGDLVEVKAPSGDKYYEITNIEYKLA